MQSFKRENNLFSENKTYLLLSHYEDHGLAKIHYNAISSDKYASIIDLEIDQHREELLSMLNPTTSYTMYSSLTIDPKEIKSATDKIFKYKIQDYISRNTNWRIGRDQTVIPKLEITFGELYVVLKFGNQTIRIRLEEIENL